MSSLEYSQKFFESMRNGSSDSARAVVPRLISMFSPQSVVDIGCGAGSWLAEFRAKGMEDYLGIDGNSTPVMDLPPENFIQVDLTQSISVNRRFDLAICLEVAEHLPATRADGLVRDLVQLAPVILFSAAIPGQGGTHHINERWPDYWFSKFSSHGYGVNDQLRLELWSDDRIEWWYRQNIVLYIDQDYASQHQIYLKSDAPLSLIHPNCFNNPHGPMQVLKRDIPRWLGLQLERVRKRLVAE